MSQAQAQLKKDAANLAYCTVKSPVAGVVIDRRVNIGQTIVSSTATSSLFLIATDLKLIQAWASVNEADIGNIHPGQPVIFTVDAFGDKVFHGVVGRNRLNATMSQNVVTYTVEVNCDNSDGKLLPYLTTNLQFETGSPQERDARAKRGTALDAGARTNSSRTAYPCAGRPGVQKAGRGGGVSIAHHPLGGPGQFRPACPRAYWVDGWRVYGGKRQTRCRRPPGGNGGKHARSGRQPGAGHAQPFPSAIPFSPRGRRALKRAGNMSHMDLIELDQITKTYRLGEVEVPVLKGVSLSVARGDMVALMGASGFGEEHFDEHPGVPGQAELRPIPARRPRNLGAYGKRARQASQSIDRVRLSELQPALPHDCF